MHTIKKYNNATLMLSKLKQLPNELLEMATQIYTSKKLLNFNQTTKDQYQSVIIAVLQEGEGEFENKVFE